MKKKKKKHSWLRLFGETVCQVNQETTSGSQFRVSESGVYPRTFSPWQKSYLTESVYKVVLQKCISRQIRQLILPFSYKTRQVDGFVRELTF